MKPVTSRQAGFRKFLGILLLALGALGTGSLLMKEIPLALFGRHTTGLVTRVEIITTSTGSKWVHGRRESRSRSTTQMDLVYSTKEGQPLTVRTTATFRTEAKVGDHHPMVYLPWQPGNAKIYSAKQLWLPMAVGTIFSTACLLGGRRLLRDAPTLAVKRAPS